MILSTAYPKIPPSLKGVKYLRTANSTSLGLECLDKLVDDGIPFPSIVLVDEKNCRKIGRILQRIYISEAISQGQNVVIASPRKCDIEDILNSVPYEMVASTAASGSLQRKDPLFEENLKIAWRFQNAPQVNSSVSSSKPKYDLAKSRAKDEIVNCNLVENIYANTYEMLWIKLEAIVNSSTIDISQPGP